MTKDGQLNPTETSEQIKERIDKMKREMRQPTQAPSTAATANGTPPDQSDKSSESAQSKANESPQTTPVQETASSSKAEQAVGSPSAPAQKADKREVDIREWAKKKGIKDEESALRSLRELERKLHEKSYEAKQSTPAPAAPEWQPSPQWTPPRPSAPTPPPQYMPDRRRIIEEEAAKLNMLPEDFEKVVTVANEISRINVERMRQDLKSQYDSQIYEIQRENRRNSELRELMTDPLFTNPEVQFEMHQILESNPKALELEPAPYTNAFHEAQRRLARRYLQENQSTEEKSGPLPNRPPSDSGRGSAASEPTTEESLKERFYAAKTAEEKAKILTSIGARPTL